MRTSMGRCWLPAVSLRSRSVPYRVAASVRFATWGSLEVQRGHTGVGGDGDVPAATSRIEFVTYPTGSIDQPDIEVRAGLATQHHPRLRTIVAKDVAEDFTITGDLLEVTEQSGLAGASQSDEAQHGAAVASVGGSQGFKDRVKNLVSAEEWLRGRPDPGPVWGWVLKRGHARQCLINTHNLRRL